MFYLERFLNAQNSGGLYDNMTDYQTALQVRKLMNIILVQVL
jgi:hypothetical protein